jgi:hypothetical protein
MELVSAPSTDTRSTDVFTASRVGPLGTRQVGSLRKDMRRDYVTALWPVSRALLRGGPYMSILPSHGTSFFFCGSFGSFCVGRTNAGSPFMIVLKAPSQMKCRTLTTVASFMSADLYDLSTIPVSHCGGCVVFRSLCSRMEAPML